MKCLNCNSDQVSRTILSNRTGVTGYCNMYDDIKYRKTRINKIKDELGELMARMSVYGLTEEMHKDIDEFMRPCPNKE